MNWSFASGLVVGLVFSTLWICALMIWMAKKSDDKADSTNVHGVSVSHYLEHLDLQVRELKHELQTVKQSRVMPEPGILERMATDTT